MKAPVGMQGPSPPGPRGRLIPWVPRFARADSSSAHLGTQEIANYLFLSNQAEFPSQSPPMRSLSFPWGLGGAWRAPSRVLWVLIVPAAWSLEGRRLCCPLAGSGHWALAISGDLDACGPASPGSTHDLTSGSPAHRGGGTPHCPTPALFPLWGSLPGTTLPGTRAASPRGQAWTTGGTAICGSSA